MLQQGIVSLPPYLIVDYDDGNGIDCDQSPADVAVFNIPFKCAVKLSGLLVTETCAGGTTTPAVKFDKRPTGGGDGSRGDGDIGDFALGTTAAGKLMIDRVAESQSLNPGEQVVVQLTVQATGVGAAGHVHPILVVEPLDEMPANLANVVVAP